MSSQPLLRALTHPHRHLQERASSYLAIIDQWASRRGLTDVVREKTGGAGKLAVVVALAARSLESTSKVHPQEHYLRQSGLSPTAFKSALEYLQQAINERDSSNATTPPRTPSRRMAKRLEGSDSTSVPAPASPTTPMSLKERAMAVQSGQAFGKSPSTPTRRFQRTPSRSGESDTAISPMRRLQRTPSRSGESSNATSTPKSVRFSEDDTAATPRAATVAYEHPYTPSKRSRLGLSHSDSTTSTPKRTRNREEDEDEEQVLRPGSSVKRQRRATPALTAEQQLDVLLFPLDSVYLAKVRPPGDPPRIDVTQWLATWGS